MERYQDDSIANANILIDYRTADPKKKVIFSYEYDDDAKAQRKRLVPLLMFKVAYLLMMIMSPFFVIALVLKMMMGDVYEPYFKFIGVTFVLWDIMISFAVTWWLISSDKRRERKLYPEFNYFITKLLSQTQMTATIYPTDVKEGVYTIHHFDNVMLSYEAMGDMASCLSKIEIKAHPYDYKFYSPIRRRWVEKKSKDFHFTCDFIFDRVPKDGKIEVDFI